MSDDISNPFKNNNIEGIELKIVLKGKYTWISFPVDEQSARYPVSK